jgi:phosphatidate phosphatase APP1
LSAISSNSSQKNKDVYSERAAPFLVSANKLARMQCGLLEFTTPSPFFLKTDDTELKVNVQDSLEYSSIGVSDSNGLSEICLDVSAKVYNSCMPLARILVFNAEYPKDFILTSVNLYPPTGVSLISDVDDTIKDSQVFRGSVAAASEALLAPMKEIHGMADAFNLMAAKNTKIHYVSAAPYQMLPTLMKFLTKFSFPQGSLNLRNIGNNSKEYKIQVISSIITDFPSRQFILVGDSGEFDIEIYAHLVSCFPSQIIQVFIRHVDDTLISTLQARWNKSCVLPNRACCFFKEPFVIFSDPIVKAALAVSSI